MGRESLGLLCVCPLWCYRLAKNHFLPGALLGSGERCGRGEERAGSWPSPAHGSQQLIRDSNQAEIFSRQLITNSNKVPAPGRGCFSPAGHNDEQLAGAFGNSFVTTCDSWQQGL